jgi:hypothetical protein
MGSELHSLIRGFLKLLGTMLIAPMADLAILIGGDCSPSDGHPLRVVISDFGDAEKDLSFEIKRLTLDPELGAEENEC